MGDLLARSFAKQLVLLEGENGTCECKGFLRHNHCKHLDSLRALRTAGKL
jgi:hypothetical protein